MVDTITTGTFKLVKPEISGSPTTWGNKLNADMDIIDGAMSANLMAGMPVGAGALWFTDIPPANWLICDGSSLSTDEYPALFNVLQYKHGGSGTSFNLPPFSNRMPMQAAVGSTGGEATHVLTAAEMPAHTHTMTDAGHTHVVTDPGHTHTVYDPQHIHNVGDNGHTHPASAYQDAHTHGGVMTPGTGYYSLAAQNPQIVSGRTDSQQPAVHVSLSGSATGVYLGYAYTGVSLYASPSKVTIASGAANVTIASTGGGTAHNNLPPFLGVNFIIKYQ